MTTNRRTIRTTLTALGAGALLLSGAGCADKVLSIPAGSVPGFIGYTGVAAAGVQQSLNQGRFGVLVTVHNQSATPVAVRLWCGKVDAREPLGVTDLRTGDDLAMLVEPGTCQARRPSKQSWPTAIEDAIVWAHVVPEGMPGAGRWIAFERPGPFVLTIVDDNGAVVIDDRHTSGYGPLPTERRIVGRVGEHPIWNSPDGAG